MPSLIRPQVPAPASVPVDGPVTPEPAVTGARARDQTNARRKGGRAMPYHRRRRRGCKAAPSLPGWLSSLESLASRAPHPAACVAAPSDPCRDGSTIAHRPPSLHEVRPSAWSTLVRQARITDIDRLASIGRASMARSGRGSLDAAGLMRQLVYLPNASLLVAEARRELVGGALLVLRPSVVAGGYVGHHRLVGRLTGPRCGPRHHALLEELLRSASNKGCSMVEAASALRSRGPRPPRARRVRPRRANALAVRRGGRCHGQPNLAPRAAGRPDRPIT